MIVSVNYALFGQCPDGLEAMVKTAKATGYDGIEASPAQVAAYGTEETKRLLRQTGMKITAFALPWNPIETDEETNAAALRALDAQAATMAAVGCTLCYTFVRSCSHDLPLEENRAFHLQRLRPITALLQKYNIRLALEFIGTLTSRKSRKYPFLYTAEDMLKLCRECGENCGLLFDAWHWYSGANNRDVFENIGGAKNIYLVHMNDAPDGDPATLPDKPRALAGETGNIDLAFVVGKLKEYAYDGPVVSESFSPTLQNAATLEEKLRMACQAVRGVLR